MLFNRELHIRYFSSNLRELPGAYCKLDTNRLTLVHFSVNALDMLDVWGKTDVELLQHYQLDRQHIIEWIYSLQTKFTDDDTEGLAGFKGGSFLGNPPPRQYNHGHIAMTYTALATLKTLGDDFDRVDTKGIVHAVGRLQLEDGSFQCVAFGSEHDMRFLYCACAVCHMLGDWSTLDIQRAVRYIQRCHSWDGAFSLLPGQEGHGGSTFCAVASLVLMGQLNEVLNERWRSDLIYWCTSRQIKGMQGRPDKLEDTCYSYWIGGTLRLLDLDGLLDHTALRSFVMQCQTIMGGFGKAVSAMPDLLHSFYSMAYLNFSQIHFDDDNRCEVRLKPLNCTLGICRDRAEAFGPIEFQ